MIRLFEAAAGLQAFLEAREWRFCFIGGIALQHWGEPRATRDIDLSLFTGFGGEAPVVDALLAAYRGRSSDARAFALRHRVLLLETAEGIPVDVALAGLPLEAAMMERAIRVEFQPGAVLRICTGEDLFVLKAFADRQQDQADLAGIARRRGRELDWEAVVERLSPLVQAKEAPAILERVRALREEFGA